MEETKDATPETPAPAVVEEGAAKGEAPAKKPGVLYDKREDFDDPRIDGRVPAGHLVRPEDRLKREHTEGETE